MDYSDDRDKLMQCLLIDYLHEFPWPSRVFWERKNFYFAWFCILVVVGNSCSLIRIISTQEPRHVDCRNGMSKTDWRFQIQYSIRPHLNQSTHMLFWDIANAVTQVDHRAASSQIPIRTTFNWSSGVSGLCQFILLGHAICNA